MKCKELVSYFTDKKMCHQTKYPQLGTDDWCHRQLSDGALNSSAHLTKRMESAAYSSIKRVLSNSISIAINRASYMRSWRENVAQKAIAGLLLVMGGSCFRSGALRESGNVTTMISKLCIFPFHKARFLYWHVVKASLCAAGPANHEEPR